MKTVGGIILFFGILAFFGAALKGNSVFGPTFWIALGVYLIYRANNKTEESVEDNNKKSESSVISNKTSVSVAAKESDSPKSVPESMPAKETQHDLDNSETLDNIQSQLTLEQRETAMCMIALFGGYANKMPQEAMTFISSQAAVFFGIPFEEASISRILAKHSDADKMIDTVLTIKPRKAKEFLLLTCHDFVNNSSSNEAEFLLENIAADMGYEKVRFMNLVNTYK